MLKKSVITLCLLLACGAFAQTQRFVYRTTYKPDSLKTTTVSEISVLDVIGQNSVYYNGDDSNRKLLSDDKIVGKDKEGEGVVKETAYLTYYIFKEKGKTDFLVYKGENAYQYEETEKIKWQIKDSIVDYKGLYQAQLAETDFGGRKWKVFFTTKIPIPNGPYKFGGLPGLIVKAESTDLDYNIELMEVQQVKDALFERPAGVLTLSKMKYLSLMKEHAQEPSMDMKMVFSRYGLASTNDISVNGVMMKPAQMYKELNEKTWNWMKTHNNPMEKDDVWLIFSSIKMQLPE